MRWLILLFSGFILGGVMTSFLYPNQLSAEDKVASSVFLPAPLINLGGRGEHAILVDKTSHRLYLYDSDYNVMKVVTVTTGQNKGDKMAEGDRKTPEGIYFFTDIIEKRELLPEYGVMALPLNYPNFVDTVKNKNGSGIWLHATNKPSRPKRPYDTRGCVVAINKDVLTIATFINLEMTPIVIVKKLSYTTPERLESERSRIFKFLKEWKDAWEKKDINGYISMYSQRFHSRGMDLKGWKRYKERLNKEYSYINVNVKNIKILRHNDYVVIAFIQNYESSGFRDTGIKRLYLMEEGGNWKIVGEEWRRMPAVSPKTIARAYMQQIANAIPENNEAMN